MSGAPAAVPTDVHAGKSASCRGGSHALCASVKCSCRCHDAADLGGPATPHECPDCTLSFSTPQGLGAHRARVHGYRSPAAAAPADRSTPGVEAGRSPGDRPGREGDGDAAEQAGRRVRVAGGGGRTVVRSLGGGRLSR